MILGFMPVKTITERDAQLVWAKVGGMNVGRGLTAVPLVDKLLIVDVIDANTCRELDKPARVALEGPAIANGDATAQGRPPPLGVLVTVGAINGYIKIGKSQMNTIEESLHAGSPVAHFRLHAEHPELCGRTEIVQAAIMYGKVEGPVWSDIYFGCNIEYQQPIRQRISLDTDGMGISR